MIIGKPLKQQKKFNLANIKIVKKIAIVAVLIASLVLIYTFVKDDSSSTSVTAEELAKVKKFIRDNPDVTLLDIICPPEESEAFDSAPPDLQAACLRKNEKKN